MIVPEAFLT
jgi:hypothetical protein